MNGVPSYVIALIMLGTLITVPSLYLAIGQIWQTFKKQ